MVKAAVPLMPYQRRWFLDRSRMKIGMFARQTGKTFTTTLEIVDSCFQAWADRRRETWIILSRGERQAKEAMNAGVKIHARAYGMALDSGEYDWSPDDWDGKESEKPVYKALEVSLPGGSRIIGLPANPDTARGFSGNVFLDEFAIHKDSRAIWGALFPIISAGHRIRVTSTPKGKGNKFYELMTQTDNRWSRHSVDIHQAVREGLPRDVEELRAGLADEELWAQEYELQWLDEASAWLSFDLINTVEHDLAGDPDLYTGGHVYVGVDIGRRRDLFVIIVLELVGDVLWCREIIERRGASFAEQDDLLDGVFLRYRVIRCCMDQTGMGEKPVEDAQRRHGSLRVEGVLLNASSQLRIATLAKEAFEDRRLRIPQGHPHLRGDLHKIKKEVGVTGNPRFVADRDSDGHADRAWATFLALAAADTPFVPMEHHTASGRTATAPSASGDEGDEPTADSPWERPDVGLLRGYL